MSRTRLFDTRNSQSEVRKYLDLPPKGWDSATDRKWGKIMDDVTDFYARAHFNTSTSWRFVPSSEKEAVTWSVLSTWRAAGLDWDMGKMEQIVLWRLQILHKRERDQWWQERKRRGSKPDETVYPSSESSLDSTESRAGSPTATMKSLPTQARPSNMYDPVRDAAANYR